MDWSRPANVAVIGAGISGIVTAHILQRKHHVTIFEKNDYVGGHTRTVLVSRDQDRNLPVDTGFIVLNDRTYPHLLSFFRQLNVPIACTDMAFSYWNPRTDFYYAGTGWRGLLAQTHQATRPRFWMFLADILKFLSRTRKKLHKGDLKGRTLAQYLRDEGYSAQLVEEFVLPMAAAIWSTPAGRVGEFPAEAFARFYDHHGLLSLVRRPTWYYVQGGSHRYVLAFLERFQGKVLVKQPVQRIHRHDDSVTVIDHSGKAHAFDAVILATHADEALAMLADPSAKEQALLSAWRYNRNRTVLHSDPSYLPPKRAAWASWNFIKHAEDQNPQRLTVSYYMNRLQKLRTDTPYCVTLNPWATRPVRHEISSFDDTHPMYTFASYETQKSLPALNGNRRTYFCGAYFGYGFHEDGVRSALAVARHFGMEL